MDITNKQESEIIQSLQEIADIMNEFAPSVKVVVENLVELMPTMRRVSLSYYGQFITPKQYHLLLHGRKRVKKKWLNVARKRIERLYKWQKGRAV